MTRNSLEAFCLSQHDKRRRESLQNLGTCLHGGGGSQVSEVKYGGSPHLSCKRDQIKMGDYMDKRITTPKRVTSPTWGPPRPCKQALNCPRRDFDQKAKSQGGTLVTQAYINLRKVLTVEIYSHRVNIGKISICLNRGREESVGSDDVSIFCARKHEMVRMT